MSSKNFLDLRFISTNMRINKVWSNHLGYTWKIVIWLTHVQKKNPTSSSRCSSCLFKKTANLVVKKVLVWWSKIMLSSGLPIYFFFYQACLPKIGVLIWSYCRTKTAYKACLSKKMLICLASCPHCGCMGWWVDVWVLIF